MQLLIDTTQKGALFFQLLDQKGRIVGRFHKATEQLSEEILTELKEFLAKNKVKLADIRQILVNPGPGAFSSTRTGVATANALALALNKPVAEWPGGRIKATVLPKYDREPNITKPKTPNRHPGGSEATDRI